MFPLFRLPLLCIQDVADQWELIDLYNFSLLSKRAKGISKRKKWSNLEVELNLHNRSLCLRKYDKSFYELIFERDRFQVRRRKIHPIDPDISSFFKATEHFMDIFNWPFETVFIEMKPPLTNDQLIMMIDWLNGIKHEIKEVYIKSATGLMLELFMNRFQRSIEKLEVQDRYIKCEGINYKRLNFEIKNSFSSYSSWYTLDFLFSMDTKRIDIDCSKFLEEDINMFLRSWQEGKTNRNLNQMDMITVGERDMRKVLKDCEGVLMDPRTTKFEVFEQKNIYSSFFSPREPNKWIHGGIHIRRNDGRLAVIDNSKYWTVNEHVSEKQIEKYEITREIWNSEDDTWFESWFHIYFF